MKPKPIVVRVGGGGRFRLPEAVAEHLDVKPGDFVGFTLEEGRVVRLQPVEFVIRQMGVQDPDDEKEADRNE